MDQPRPRDDDHAVSETAAELENCHVTPARRPVNLSRVGHKALEISLGVAVQVPIGRIERHIDMRDHARCLIHLGEQHQAIGTPSFDPTHMVIRCPQPSFGLGDYH